MPAPARRLRGAHHLAALAAAVLTQAAWAQPAPKAVGELLDRGGMQLSSADLRALLAGASMRGTGLEGRPFELMMSPDGRLSGVVGFERVDATGIWLVDDQDRLCVDMVWAKEQPLKRCFPWFRLGEQYFQALGTDRGKALMPRTVAR
jgi:hypothetical protein